MMHRHPSVERKRWIVVQNIGDLKTKAFQYVFLFTLLTKEQYYEHFLHTNIILKNDSTYSAYTRYYSSLKHR